MKTRIIIFGGIGFSGYNDEFNANNGIYRDVINREQEKYETLRFEKLYMRICEIIPDKNIIILTHTPIRDWCMTEIMQKGYIYVSGHTHRNYFYDDGEYRIYSDNQVGYYNENCKLKYFHINNKYDIFQNYENGVYEITREQYIEFYRGKNIQMAIGSDKTNLYMLKKNGYYCFINRKINNKLSIFNGGRIKNLENDNIDYYYDHMDEVVDYINGPLTVYNEFQKNLSEKIKAIGGYGTIHGCIVDIDFFNHAFVNPFDYSVTGYYAANMINKIIYPSLPKLLENNCPLMFLKYKSMIKNRKDFNLITKKDAQKYRQGEPELYLETDIYKVSREIKKMQRLNEGILTTWIEPKNKQIEI